MFRHFRIINWRIFIAIIIVFIMFCNESFTQSKVDSIIREVELLNKNYQQQLSKLYQQMLSIDHDRSLEGLVRYKASMSYHYFPVKENIERLLDSLDHESGSINERLDEMYPHYGNLGKMIYQDEAKYPAIIQMLVKKLDDPLSEEALFLYSVLIKEYVNVIGFTTLQKSEIAECLRIMSDSLHAGSPKKQNLIAIADILENK